MKRWGLYVSILLLAVAILLHFPPKSLRSAVDDLATLGYDTANTRDVWRVLLGGNLVPGADNTYSIGTTALSVASIVADGTALLGTLSTTGAGTVVGSMTVSGVALHSGGSVESGREILTRTAVGTGATGVLGVYASSTILVTTNYMVVSSSANNIALVSTPNVSTTTTLGGATSYTSGTYVIFTSTRAGSVTFQDEGTLTGSLLQLGSTGRVVGQYDTLILMFDSVDGFWREVAYVDN